MENVSLQKSESTDEPRFIMRNDTENSIYVSYVPPEPGNIRTKFLAYGLEKATNGGDFKPYGEGFHFIPPLAPLPPNSTVEFAVISPPKEPGEYRIFVGYYQDESVFRLITNKGSNLTDSEKQEVTRQQRIVRSATFSVP